MSVFPSASTSQRGKGKPQHDVPIPPAPSRTGIDIHSNSVFNERDHQVIGADAAAATPTDGLFSMTGDVRSRTKAPEPAGGDNAATASFRPASMTDTARTGSNSAIPTAPSIHGALHGEVTEGTQSTDCIPTPRELTLAPAATTPNESTPTTVCLAGSASAGSECQVVGADNAIKTLTDGQCCTTGRIGARTKTPAGTYIDNAATANMKPASRTDIAGAGSNSTGTPIPSMPGALHGNEVGGAPSADSTQNLGNSTIVPGATTINTPSKRSSPTTVVPVGSAFASRKDRVIGVDDAAKTLLDGLCPATGGVAPTQAPGAARSVNVATAGCKPASLTDIVGTGSDTVVRLAPSIQGALFGEGTERTRSADHIQTTDELTKAPAAGTWGESTPTTDFPAENASDRSEDHGIGAGDAGNFPADGLRCTTGGIGARTETPAATYIANTEATDIKPVDFEEARSNNTVPPTPSMPGALRSEEVGGTLSAKPDQTPDNSNMIPAVIAPSNGSTPSADSLLGTPSCSRDDQVFGVDAAVATQTDGLCSTTGGVGSATPASAATRSVNAANAGRKQANLTDIVGTGNDIEVPLAPSTPGALHGQGSEGTSSAAHTQALDEASKTADAANSDGSIPTTVFPAGTVSARGEDQVIRAGDGVETPTDGLRSTTGGAGLPGKAPDSPRSRGTAALTNSKLARTAKTVRKGSDNTVPPTLSMSGALSGGRTGGALSTEHARPPGPWAMPTVTTAATDRSTTPAVFTPSSASIGSRIVREISHTKGTDVTTMSSPILQGADMPAAVVTAMDVAPDVAPAVAGLIRPGKSNVGAEGSRGNAIMTAPPSQGAKMSALAVAAMDVAPDVVPAAADVLPVSRSTVGAGDGRSAMDCAGSVPSAHGATMFGGVGQSRTAASGGFGSTGVPTWASTPRSNLYRQAVTDRFQGSGCSGTSSGGRGFPAATTAAASRWATDSANKSAFFAVSNSAQGYGSSSSVDYARGQSGASTSSTPRPSEAQSSAPWAGGGNSASSGAWGRGGISLAASTAAKPMAWGHSAGPASVKASPTRTGGGATIARGSMWGIGRGSANMGWGSGTVRGATATSTSPRKDAV